MSTTEQKVFGCGSAALSAYVSAAFHMDDPVLAEIRQRAAAAGLPSIHLSEFDARHLEVLARAAGARKIVEIGTLAGLSGVCLARVLPPGGRLHTFELDPRHAEVAAESFRRSGFAAAATIHVGPALDMLPLIEADGPFDLVFIDADKPGYPAYLDWAARNLRIGGVVVGDNTLSHGTVAQAEAEVPPGVRETRAAILAFNRTLADPGGLFRSTMIPTGEGLSVGVRIR